MTYKQVMLSLLMAAAVAQPVGAQNLPQDFVKALSFDPSFQSSKADYQVGQRNVKQAKSVFFPEATFNTQRLANDTGTRATFTVTQPLLDAQRWMTLGQAAPQQLLAEVTLQSKRQELATRLLKAANAIILANESIRLNTSKMEALDQQAQAASQKLKLGQGTVTDLRDIEVKASQAKAQQLSFTTQLQNSLKAYEAITGVMPKVSEFELPITHGGYGLLPLSDYTQLALRSGPNVLAARFNLEIAEFEVKKIKASFLPSVTAQYSYSKSTGAAVANSYVGIGLSVPLKAGTVYGMEAAEASVVKAQETLRETESKVRLESDRLVALVSSGIQALRIQREAIAAAELSVEANRQSYQGGVRTAVDVINALQTAFQVKSDYYNLATTQSENILNLILLAATDPQDAVTDTYRYLFVKL
ncbi:MAG: TolC family protein [Polaromonas sp.]|nr:TolC family protein [Polaromonas sp.]